MNMGIFYGIYLVSHNPIMNMNNVMSNDLVVLQRDCGKDMHVNIMN